jgi:hypothetical protein
MHRSYLFAPGHSAKLLTKVFDAGADAVMLDLEDAVPPEAKKRARARCRPARRRAWIAYVVPTGCGAFAGRPGDRRADTTSGGGSPGLLHPVRGSFPGAFDDPANLVVGPLALVGGGYTPASVVHDFGGNKFPLLVRAGHTVTIRIPWPASRASRLAYGLLPHGEVRLRDSRRAMTFVACRSDETSDSDVDEDAVTFWSGFVLAGKPMCVPLHVHVDDERSPRQVGLPLGRRCG